MNAETRSCKQCQQPYVIEAEDFGFYEKMGVPAPVLCPICRSKRRDQLRNETTLYSRTCAVCKKSVVSMYHPKSPYTVYCDKCWESDQWDRFSYAQDYDPKRPFFEQLGELLVRVPKKATYISGLTAANINSEYTNVAGGNKNCYLVFNSGYLEDVSYSRGLRYCRDSLDLYYANNSERSYEGVNIQQSNGVAFGQNVSGSLDSSFVMNVSGIQNCFGCVNLRNKTYHFLNEPLSKEEYEKKTGAIRGSYSRTQEFWKQFKEFSLKFPRRENTNLKTVNSNGDFLVECKNVQHCFEQTSCEDCKYSAYNKSLKASYDTTGYGYDSELLLECVGVGYSSRVIGSYWVEGQSQNVEYSFAIRGGENMFGCDGFKKAKYCILNKQYSEVDYKKIRAQIVAELQSKQLYGLAMSPEIAPFAYNETIAQDNFPLTKEQALKEGFRWQDDIQITKGKETMKSEQIPDHIRDVKDSIVNEVLGCISCGRNYKLIPAELQFYRKMILPVPRQCFYCRHQARLARRGPLTLYDRKCDHCQKDIKTNFAPGRPEIVYCESCYQKEVI